MDPIAQAPCCLQPLLESANTAWLRLSSCASIQTLPPPQDDLLGTSVILFVCPSTQPSWGVGVLSGFFPLFRAISSLQVK